MRHHLIAVRTSHIKKKKKKSFVQGIEKNKPSYTVCGNVDWYSPYGKKCGNFSKDYKQNYQMTQHINTKLKGNCTPIFIAALFTIEKIWKQPYYPRTDDQLKKVWYIHTMYYYSDNQKGKLICGNMTRKDYSSDYETHYYCTIKGGRWKGLF